MDEISVQYSLFATDEGEYFTGCCGNSVEYFAGFISGALEQALLDLLNDNPHKTLCLVIESTKSHSCKEKVNDE